MTSNRDLFKNRKKVIANAQKLVVSRITKNQRGTSTAHNKQALRLPAITAPCIIHRPVTLPGRHSSMLSARRWADTIALLLCSSCIVRSNIRADFSAHHHQRLLIEGIGQEEDVSECILLFGAYCNGNMGDVIQASTLSRLVSSVSPEASCVWHAHPSKEALANGFHEGMS